MAAITEVELYNPKHCFKNNDIGPNNLEVDFTVTVDADGCYAIAVVVLDEDDFSPDDVIASNLANAKLKCLCLKRGQPMKFAINGGGNGPKPAPEAGRTQLDNMTGVWPTDDGALDDTLGLYVRIDVYPCSLEACQEGAECNRTLNTGRIDDFTPVASYTSEDNPQETEIVDGEGFERAQELIEKGVSAAGAAKSLVRNETRPASDLALELALRRNRELDRKFALLKRRVSALERSPRLLDVQPPSINTE
jgi:hypothetical protein